MKTELIKFVEKLRRLDPAKHCAVYRVAGCAHIDGMLCNVRTCTIKISVEVSPRDVKEVKT